MRVRANGPDEFFAPKVIDSHAENMIAPVIFGRHRIKNKMGVLATHLQCLDCLNERYGSLGVVFEHIVAGAGRAHQYGIA